MREERIRADLDGTWSTVVDVTHDRETRISLEFHGTERQLRNWLPEDYEILETADTSEGSLTALLQLEEET